MKTKLIVLVSLLTLLGASALRAELTAFTYQGRLNDGGNPVTGSYDLRFRLLQTNNGQPQGPVLTNSAVAVSNGLFSVVLDFGDYFGDRDFSLEIGVRTNGSAEAFTILSPSQPITPTPLAVAANHALSLSGPLPNTTFFDAPSGISPFSVTSDTLVANLNSDSLDGFDSSAFWKIGGNIGTAPGAQFLGTSDNQAFEIKVNGVRALRLEPAANGFPNVIGGAVNSIAAGESGGTISGGRENNLNATHGTISGGWRHTIQTGANDSVIGGGQNNVISNLTQGATIGGGVIHVVGPTADNATIGGGRFNRIGAASVSATVGGGRNNLISANSPYATISGGTTNTIKSAYSAITGGNLNDIEGGGSANSIGGGSGNIIEENNVSSIIAGGTGNFIEYFVNAGTISGGEHNHIQTSLSGNTIGGGANNIISSGGAFFGAGQYATVPGGFGNFAAGYASFAAGNRAQAWQDGAFVWADATDEDFFCTAPNQFAIRASGGVQLSTNTSLFFGQQTRQMLNLWGTSYGIGVQGYTEYFRVDNGGGFAWYQGGTHNDAQNNPGGGTVEMRLDNNGNLFTAGAVNPVSDRNAKENFSPVEAKDVLAKVAALPLTSWNYKKDTATRHVGPMAQDFYAAFAVGTDDKHIATVDADGVALAAIQGLNKVVREKENEIRKLQSQNSEMEKRLSHLEKLVEQNRRAK
jgi:hypothetical protein